jgi:hypothetical protein
MAKQALGRLESVPLREYWQREDTDFTPWLAEEENLRYLGEVVGMKLSLEETETNVGPYRADILCRDLNSEAYVLIENQLEPTDHKHLGQLLTYSAGLDTFNIIWIAENFSEEHRAALDWLNQITIEEFHFFGIEVELYRIGESSPAPSFNVVAKPNDWTKSVRGQQRRSSSYGERAEFFRQLWGAMINQVKAQYASLPLPNPSGMHWIRLDIGYSRAVLSFAPSTKLMSLYLFSRAPEAVTWYEFLRADLNAFDEKTEIAFEFHDNESPGYGLYQFKFDHEAPDTHADHFERLGHQLANLQEVITELQDQYEDQGME